MPLFSVVTPVYNRERLIGRTLESIFSQEWPDIEIIVVDDGSTDGTRSVLRSYDDRIRLFCQQNEGPGAARNVGIDEAEGEYIAFLDSDDLWFPWTLDTYAEIIRQFDRPAFIAGNPYLFDQEDDLGNVKKDTPQTEYFSDYLASGEEWRWWGVSSFVMRRDALVRVGGFTERPINGEDADLAMKMGTERGFVTVSSGSTFAYRKHGEQLMASAEKNAEGASYLVDREKGDRYPGGQKRRFERWRILSRHTRPASLACLDAGLFNLGWSLYLRTFRWNWSLRRWKYLLGFPLRGLQRAFAS